MTAPGKSIKDGAVNATTGEYITRNHLGDAIYKTDMVAQTFTTVSLSMTLKTGDIEFNPSTGLLYTWDKVVADVLSIDPVTGVVTALGATGAVPVAGNDIGAVYFDANGLLNLYNNVGELYRYNVNTNVTVLVGTAPAVAKNDGAPCFNNINPCGAPEKVDDEGTCVLAKHQIPNRLGWSWGPFFLHTTVALGQVAFDQHTHAIGI